MAALSHIHMKMNVMGAVVLVVGGLAARPAAARFVEEDPRRIDPEDHYSTETYNDKTSYRYPLSWQRRWRKALTGYQVGAGSLHATRFDFEEDIKFATDPTAPYSFGFRSSRREDVLERRSEQEIRTSWKPAWDVRYSLMADGGAWKEYGDLGLGVAWIPARRHYVELVYWSVDHYYPTKKAHDENKRDGQWHTWQLRGEWPLSEGWVRFDVERDHPFTWKRPSEGYHYRYRRQKAEMEARIGPAKGHSVKVSGSYESKSESKKWLGGGNDGFTHAKELDREVRILEMAWVRSWDEAGDESDILGTQWIRRDADYEFRADKSLKRKDYAEEPGPPQSKRREAALYGIRHTSWGTSGRHFGQYGIFANRVFIKEDDDHQATEVKLQLAWDYRYDERARVLLGTTWNLDQLARDFPYRQEPFRPWDGGNIEFQAVF